MAGEEEMGSHIIFKVVKSTKWCVEPVRLMCPNKGSARQEVELEQARPYMRLWYPVHERDEELCLDNCVVHGGLDDVRYVARD
ncbi:hypothetical protein BJV82DRAFT_663112 [Fennellomyces sp. T-0311]|nr:hypothetical protein BJV82DRAFT_663112 [Fennellomyces sp. T-0311]